MKTVWKFDIDLDKANQAIQMPVGAAFLHLSTQFRFDTDEASRQTCYVSLWMLVETTAPAESRSISIVKTGDALPEPVKAGDYAGTIHGLSGRKATATHVFLDAGSANAPA